MNYIIDPLNGNTYSIFSQNGKILLKNTLVFINNRGY